MTSESGTPEERRWLVEPEQGAVQIAIAVGEGAELTPEAREAIDRLMSVIRDSQVQGYQWKCTTDTSCTSESTGGGLCHPRYVTCEVRVVQCHIGAAPGLGGLPPA